MVSGMIMLIREGRMIFLMMVSEVIWFLIYSIVVVMLLIGD